MASIAASAMAATMAPVGGVLRVGTCKVASGRGRYAQNTEVRMRHGTGRRETSSLVGTLAACALAALVLVACGTHRGEGGWAKDANASVRDAANSVGIGLGTGATSPAALGNGKNEGIKELEATEEDGRRDGLGAQPGPDDWRIITSSFRLFRHAPYVADMVLGLLAAVGVGLALTASGRAGTFDPVARTEQRRATVICALIGCIAAELVQAAEQFYLGAEIALVLFGIGGLVRFRTVFDDPRQTGLAIIAAVLGLACGMSEYALAAIALVIVYLVNWWLTRTTVLRIRVRGRKGADLGALQAAVSRELGARGVSVLRVTPVAADREVEFFARTESVLDLDELLGALHGAAPGARVKVTWS
jgi:hypothetical protein